MQIEITPRQYAHIMVALREQLRFWAASGNLNAKYGSEPNYAYDQADDIADTYLSILNHTD